MLKMANANTIFECDKTDIPVIIEKTRTYLEVLQTLLARNKKRLKSGLNSSNLVSKS